MKKKKNEEINNCTKEMTMEETKKSEMQDY